MSHKTTDLLVSRLIAKDQSAFELVFHEYYSALCQYAASYLHDVSLAEGIVQEVFVRFWEKCQELAPDSSIKSYLYRAVHNACLNHIKHLKVRDNYRQYVIDQMEQAEDPIEESEEELEKQVLRAIDKLPPQCRKIFRMSRLEGLKYREIAEHLELSIKTVEVQMGKALRFLREELKDYR